MAVGRLSDDPVFNVVDDDVGRDSHVLFEAWVALVGSEVAAKQLENAALSGNWELLTTSSALDVMELRFGECAIHLLAEALADPNETFDDRSLARIDGRSEPSVDWDLQAQRIQAELTIRRFERNGDYLEARMALEHQIGRHSGLLAHLANEYKYLLAGASSDLDMPGSDLQSVVDLFGAIRRGIAAPSANVQGRRLAADAAEDLVADIEQPADRATMPRLAKRTETPQADGDALEVATLRLFTKIFKIAADDSERVVALVRRQTAGSQRGFDLAFEATAADSGRVRCLVECKNYSRPITLDQVAGKLLAVQAGSTQNPLDQWILVSPHSDPSNDLQQYLDAERELGNLPFEIQIWSPQSGIQDLIATEGALFRRLYESDPLVPNTDDVIAEFKRRLQPALRLPRALVDYLRRPYRQCFESEDADHYAALLGHHIELGVLDATGRRMPISLSDRVDGWLEDDSSSGFLLLGEFGDGKSFFTYQLARELSAGFLADPSGYFPIRMQLKDLAKAGNPEVFLQNFFSSRVGCSLSDWWEVAVSHRVLVILDGFDEMSDALDPTAMNSNLKLLADTVSYVRGPSTAANAGSKVLATSRGRFFDQPREETVLRERLGYPTIARIRPAPRSDVLAHLTEWAHESGQAHKFDLVKQMYDPIGLAAKPLFLEMIKATLGSLPDDSFDTAVLYETYIRASLDRKSELLLGGTQLELRKEVIERLISVLEAVAVAAQSTPDGVVDLRDVEDIEGADMAHLLWEIAKTHDESSALVDDARARVAVRSLLRSVRADDPSAWAVSFFHRSIGEYLLARTVCEALVSDDVGRLQDALRPKPLTAETIEFVRQMANVTEPRLARLLAIARMCDVLLDSGPALGGNALSLYYAMAGTLPPIEDLPELRGLKLDYASLAGADLSRRSLRGSSLRAAILDNADLRDADLRDCDLTGIRLERTTAAASIAVDVESACVYAAYSDGVIRRWRRVRPDHWVAETAFEGLDGQALDLELLTPEIAMLRTRSELWLFGRGLRWTVQSVMPATPMLRSVAVRNRVLESVHGCDAGELRLLDLSTSTPTSASFLDVNAAMADSAAPLIEPLRDRTAVVRGQWMLSDHWAAGTPGRALLWNLTTGARWELPKASLTSAFDVDHDNGTRQLYVGTRTGGLLSGTVDDDARSVTLEPLPGVAHGSATRIVRAAGGVIASGSSDRRIRIWSGTQGVLYLAPRCHGVKLDGVTGAQERAMLAVLAAADAADDDLVPLESSD